MDYFQTAVEAMQASYAPDYHIRFTDNQHEDGDISLTVIVDQARDLRDSFTELFARIKGIYCGDVQKFSGKELADMFEKEDADKEADEMVYEDERRRYGSYYDEHRQRVGDVL